MQIRHLTNLLYKNKGGQPLEQGSLIQATQILACKELGRTAGGEESVSIYCPEAPTLLSDQAPGLTCSGQSQRQTKHLRIQVSRLIQEQSPQTSLPLLPTLKLSSTKQISNAKKIVDHGSGRCPTCNRTKVIFSPPLMCHCYRENCTNIDLPSFSSVTEGKSVCFATFL